MFGEKFHGGTVPHRIGLCEIFHRIYNHTLPFDVASVSNRHPAAALGYGHYWNGKDFSHTSLRTNFPVEACGNQGAETGV